MEVFTLAAFLDPQTHYPENMHITDPEDKYIIEREKRITSIAM